MTKMKKNQPIPSIGEGEEEMEPSYTAGGNLKW